MKKKPNLLFKVENKITRKDKQCDQILIIDYIDYSRGRYIFKEPWINSLSKFLSLEFEKVHTLFKLV